MLMYYAKRIVEREIMLDALTRHSIAPRPGWRARLAAALRRWRSSGTDNGTTNRSGE